MKRFSRIVLWVILIELVVSVAIGTRLRNQLERPVQYLGAVEKYPGAVDASVLAAQPLHAG
jgi:hypothetical protein